MICCSTRLSNSRNAKRTRARQGVEMERILFAIGLGVGKLLVGIVELIIYACTSRTPKQTALALPLPVRFEHTHIVAGSGHGKTQLLEHLIATHDLSAVASGSRSLIVMDSQG